MSILTVTERDAVRVLTLNRPDVRNAIDTALLGALLDSVGEAVADDAVRALVLTGAGGAFSGGADLREPLDHDAGVRRAELFAAVYEAVATCPLPTVAAVTGPCVGGGAELAAACDLRVADETGFFRFPGAALGSPVGPAKLVGLVGLGTAKDFVLTARTVGAREAARAGLVQRLVPDGESLDAALQLAATIAAHPPAAVAYAKRAFARFSGVGDRVAVESDALVALAMADNDLAAIDPPDTGRGSWGWSGPS